MTGIDPATAWVRARSAHVIAQRDRLLLVGADERDLRELRGPSAALVEAVLDAVAGPADRDAVLAAIVERAGGALPDPAVVDDALALLRDVGAIHAAPGPAAPAPPRVGPRIVLGVSGSVGAVDTPRLIAALHRRGCDVWVAATRAALGFVPVLGLEALTHRRVVRALWSRDPATPVPHLALAAWADAIVICPATATTIARLAGGDHGDVVAAAALAARVPVLIAPAMNPVMLDEPAVARNLATLRADGFYLVPPGLAVEVADAPGARLAQVGGAPSGERMAALVMAVLRAQPPPARAAIDWEAEHAARAPGPDDAAVDDELAAALAEHAAPPGLLLDVGTGSGALAIHAARAGFTVIATERSATALARARVRAGDLPITWLLDDVTDSQLAGGVAVAIDRGVLHHLPASAQPRWAHTMVRLVRPGGVLIVKLDAADAPASRPTARLAGAALARLLAPGFAVVAERASTLPGRAGPSPAITVVLRRV